MSTPDEWRRPGPTPRQRRTDLAIGAGVTVAALLNVMLIRSSGTYYDDVEHSAAEQLAWAFAITLPLVWRRRLPEVVLAVTAVVFIAGQVRGAQEPQFAGGAIFTAIYALGAWGPDRSRARWLRLAVIGAMFVWLAVAWLIASTWTG
jgi:hypothetical protein